MPDAMPAGFPGAESLARRPPKDLPYCVPLEVLEANVPGAQIIGISGCSDADPDLYNNNKASGTRRCDAYYQHRIATEFMTSQPDYMPGRVYYLAALPPGYTGSEVPRKNDPKHYDRYIHGNKNGVYRSVPEFIPHFKWLQGGRQGNCTCTKCTGIATRTKPKPKSSAPKVAAPKVTAPKARARKVTDITRTPPIAKPRLVKTIKVPENNETSWIEPEEEIRRNEPKKEIYRKMTDSEGTPDIYEKIIEKLKEAGPGVVLDEAIEESLSPDWRAESPNNPADSSSATVLDQPRQQPGYVPRIGEVVLFVRKLEDGQTLAWDRHTFRHVDMASQTWLDQPKWEAGVITQMPQDPISELDLTSLDGNKSRALMYSGFRIEPLPEPGASKKPFSKQHKLVPLHLIRPMALWRECLSGVPEGDWHSTITHALMIASSFCVVGRHRFRGEWPNATVFARAMYLGSELINVGDTVRLLTKESRHQKDVTDVMTITAIRLRLVNLHFEDDKNAPEPPALPYQTCLHLSGVVHTLKPLRSFDGGKSVASTRLDVGALPQDYPDGNWYHYSDPSQPGARVEVPFHRVLGRSFENVAFQKWFTIPEGLGAFAAPVSSSQTVNTGNTVVSEDTKSLSRGLKGVLEARKYSRQHDPRLLSAGWLWLWADTRVQQLDLHEVNGHAVGPKDPLRTRSQVKQWHQALKGLGGETKALEVHHAAKVQAMNQDRAKLRNTPHSMMTSSAPIDVDAEYIQDDEEMDTGSMGDGEGDNVGSDGEGSAISEEEDSMSSGREVIVVDDNRSSGGDESAGRGPEDHADGGEMNLDPKHDGNADDSAAESSDDVEMGTGPDPKRDGNANDSAAGSSDDVEMWTGFDPAPVVPRIRSAADGMSSSDSEDEDRLVGDKSVGQLFASMRSGPNAEPE